MSNNSIVVHLNPKGIINVKLNEHTKLIPPRTQKKFATPSTQVQHITPDEGYTGLSEVEINGINLQDKDITIISNGTYNIAPDEDYDGLNNANIIVKLPADIDWSEIGYNEAPQTITDDFEYSKDIMENWDNTETNLNQKFYNNKLLRYMPLVDTSNASNMREMFYNCENLEVCPDLDTRACTMLDGMFRNCKRLRKAPTIDARSAGNFTNLFSGCTVLTEANFLNTENVNNTSNMFAACPELLEIDGTKCNLDTSNVQNMQGMFGACTKLKKVINLNTSNVVNMNAMFNQDSSLEDIPVFDTSKVVRFQNTFAGCSNLTNESLNNILQMCINATLYTGAKTLAYIGISQTQATTCETLSNWSAFVQAGWSSGW